MPISAEHRLEPKSTLQKMDVHSGWVRHFRTPENDRFYNLAFDYVADVFGPPGSDEVVDAGCGSAVKSLQLARRGYRVRGLDFSETILEHARTAAEAAGFSRQISFSQADLTALAIASGSVRHVMCWGVLMHIPDIERAVAELSRIVAPGGKLVVSEGNMRSIQARTLRFAKRLLGREKADLIHTQAGIEYWEETSTGRLMTRQADIPWLISAFERHGLRLAERRAGQFTEIYTILPYRALRVVTHLLNNFWFKFLRSGGPAFANILVFQRPD